eukprot:3836818-Amphidinium_carterae.1
MTGPLTSSSIQHSVQEGRHHMSLQESCEGTWQGSNAVNLFNSLALGLCSLPCAHVLRIFIRTKGLRDKGTFPQPETPKRSSIAGSLKNREARDEETS